jgi:hypothetical protein
MRAANNHSKMLKPIGLGAAAVLLAMVPASAWAGKFKVLYSQCVNQPSCSDGRQGSTGPLVMDSAGNLYGLTPGGVAFVLKRTGTGRFKYRAVLHFSGGAQPGGMVIDSQGNLYGWASQFFKMSYGHGSHHNRWDAEFPALNCSTPPCGGTDPRGTLTYAGAASGAPWDGVSPLYGVMNNGGLNNGGTVYRLTPGIGGWTYAVLYNFCALANCGDGSRPVGGVLLDQSGVLYGTTAQGGCSSTCSISGGAGVAFALAPSGGNIWTETVLHTFCSQAHCADGSFPTANLAEDAAGNLIGVTAGGGGSGKHEGGTLYKLTPNGAQSQETVLYDFCRLSDCRDGASPIGTPVLDTAGNIFGTTDKGGGNDNDQAGIGGGVAYEMGGTTFQKLHAFCAQPGCSDGEYPGVGLLQDGLGHLYGTTEGGGTFNEGAVYELTP